MSQFYYCDLCKKGYRNEDNLAICKLPNKLGNKYVTTEYNTCRDCEDKIINFIRELRGRKLNEKNSLSM